MRLKLRKMESINLEGEKSGLIIQFLVENTCLGNAMVEEARHVLHH